MLSRCDAVLRWGLGSSMVWCRAKIAMSETILAFIGKGGYRQMDSK
jgi:hypothetical protein